MSLKSIAIPRQTIDVGGESFQVRGLSMNDLQILLNHHQRHVGELFDRILRVSEKSEVDDIQAQAVISSAIAQFPKLIAEAIALAADEPDATAQAMMLPMPDQVEAILAVWTLTFREEGSLKKFVGLVLNQFPQARRVMAHVAASQTGSGKSVKT